MRIALAQINATVGALRKNSTKIIEFIRYARIKNVDVIVFPELAICGYPPEDLLHKDHFIKDTCEALRSIIKETEDIVTVVGCLDRDKKRDQEKDKEK